MPKESCLCSHDEVTKDAFVLIDLQQLQNLNTQTWRSRGRFGGTENKKYTLEMEEQKYLFSVDDTRNALVAAKEKTAATQAN